MRFIAASIFSEGNPLMLVAYILCFPAGILFTYIMRPLMGLPMTDMLESMFIFAMVAIMLDGFAFGFTKLYGVGEHELYAAAFLLWAPGVFMLMAFVVIRRAKQSSSRVIAQA
ncbi:MAG: hypothetical protein AAF126_18425, partial [Chloroflexota bacterium]